MMGRSLWSFLVLCVILSACRKVSISVDQDIGDGTNIRLWTCDPSRADYQQWEYENDTTIRLKSDGKCIDISNYGSTSGSNVWLWSCHTGDKDPKHQNQEWNIEKDGTIRSAMSGLCMDAAAFGKVNGTNIQIWSCSGGKNQKWKLNSDGTITGADSGLCLDAGEGGGPSPWMDPCSNTPGIRNFPYCNSSLPFEDRALDLVERMTLDEKISLTTTFTQPIERLGVPPLDTTECLRGALGPGGQFSQTTCFPQAITNAASFNRTLFHSIARAVSDEARSITNGGFQNSEHGVHWGAICWSPVVNICRDIRWGRCQETYGEDPFLTAALAHEYVTGLQRGPDYPEYLEVVSTCKHYDVHSGPENYLGNRMNFNAIVSPKDWIETFEPAFEACAKAGVRSYMCSYNAINGIPSCANTELLQGIARDWWGMDGMIVGDCGAVDNIYSQHKYAKSPEEGAAMAMNAGTDWDCGGKQSYKNDAVQKGLLSSAVLDTSIFRLLKVFFELGYFDSPDLVKAKHLNPDDVLNSPEHRALAREAAARTVVLLENRNSVLPLNDKSKIVGIVGPNGNIAQAGDYNPSPPYTITPLDAAKEYFTDVQFAIGCSDGVPCEKTDGFDEAVNVAKSSDIVIAVVGTDASIEAEGVDRPQITLPGKQEELVQEVFNAISGSDKLFLVVYVSGAPVVSTWISEHADALLDAGFGGQEAGHGMFDVILGNYSPSARLPVTHVKTVDDLPYFTNYSMSDGVGRTYRYLTVEPLYYFGYGLSYTTFKYSDFVVEPEVISPCFSVVVTCVVTNTGTVEGTEIVQLYLSITNSSVTVPIRDLAGFETVLLPPGKSATVSFTISPRAMSTVLDLDSKKYPQAHFRAIEPSSYAVQVGGGQFATESSVNILKGKFVVVGSETFLEDCP